MFHRRSVLTTYIEDPNDFIYGCRLLAKFNRFDKLDLCWNEWFVYRVRMQFQLGRGLHQIAVANSTNNEWCEWESARERERRGGGSEKKMPTSWIMYSIDSTYTKYWDETRFSAASVYFFCSSSFGLTNLLAKQTLFNFTVQTMKIRILCPFSLSLSLIFVSEWNNSLNHTMLFTPIQLALLFFEVSAFVCFIQIPNEI